MNISDLSYKIKNREEICRIGIVDFIKDVFKNKQNEISECLINLYHDLTFIDLKHLIKFLGSKFIDELYNLKDELKIDEITFLNFNNIHEFNIIKDSIIYCESSFSMLNDEFHTLKDKLNYIFQKSEFNIDALNKNFEIIEGKIQHKLYEIERIKEEL